MTRSAISPLTQPPAKQASAEPLPAEQRSPTVYMMDLLAIVPYYTAYLSRALKQAGAKLSVGSISYYLDLTCFSGRGLKLDPGALDIVGRHRLPRPLRRALKLVELAANLCALTLRFTFRPPDILHVQYLPMLQSCLPLDAWFVRLCRRRGIRIVLTVHDLLPHDTADRYRSVFHDLYHVVDHLICHSTSVQTRLVSEFQIDVRKTSVIAHGPFFYDLPPSSSVNLRQRFGVPADAALVLWQGLIFPYKGVDLLLEAWTEIEQISPSAFLVIAGTGAPDLLAQLARQIAILGLKRITFHQQFISTEDLVGLYRTAAIVVYPYRAITTSGALATGLAFSKAIIATDLPVFREVLVNGENALLIAQEKNALVHAVVKLLSDRQLRNIFSEKISALRFGDASWREIANATLFTYNQVIASLRK